MFLGQFPLLTRFIILVVTPILGLSLFLGSKLYDSLPEKQSFLVVNGISDPVTINRDKFGYVSIDAVSEQDAFFAMGYAQAQDRLWQLEVQRRIAKGTLSEIFGREFVEHDVWLRTLGLYQSAEFAWQVLSAEAQMSLKSFSEGVNAYLKQNKSLPPEFLLLGLEMDPWSPVDSLAWVKVFALNLAGNYRKELENQAIISVLSADKISSLYPVIAANSIFREAGDWLLIKQAAGLEENAQVLQEKLSIGGKYVGSNAWVISGKYTDNGKAVLVNDPHVGLQIPSLWYGAAIKSTTLKAKGFTLVGLPIIVFGRNEKIAWGGTNLMADVQDLTVEQVQVNSPNTYLKDGKWHTMSQRMEKISIRNKFPDFLRKKLKPIEFIVRETSNGPIISDVQEDKNQVFSMSWTALQKDDTSYQAFFDINYAKDWHSFNVAADKLVAPALNLLYSDTEGNIGLAVAGRIPIRKTGNGSLPVPGWSSEFDWDGYIPATELPQIYNPDSGFIASANDRVFDASYPYFISHDFAPEARVSRIREFLSEKINKGQLISIQDSINLQRDTLDLSIKTILPLLKSIECQTDLQCEVMAKIAEFEGDMRADEVAPTIISVWLEHLKIALFRDDFKHYWLQKEKASLLSAALANISIEQIISALTVSNNNQLDWCDNIQTDVHESCMDIMTTSLDETIKELKKLAGSEMDDWVWGRVHSTQYRHMPMSNVKLLQFWFEQRLPAGGSENSVNVANAVYDPSQGYIQNFGAGFRQIISMVNDDSAYFVMNSTGQSGHFLSENYDDAVQLFHTMQFHHLHHQLDVVAQRLVLKSQPQ